MFNSIRKYKLNSRAIIMMSRWQPVFIAAVYTVLVLIMSYIVLSASGYMQVMTDYVAAVEAGGEPELTLPTITALDSVIVIVIAVLLGLLEAGFNIAMLMLSRGKLSRVKDLFNGFNAPFKMLVITVLVSVMTTVGYMLFVVPGIVLSNKYRFAVQALYDDPTLGPIAALRRSSELTRGHIMELFLLDVSFIPWRLASYFVSLVLSFAVLDAWVLPYVQLAFSVKYNVLSGWEPKESDNQADSYIHWKKADEMGEDYAQQPDFGSTPLYTHPAQPTQEPVQPVSAPVQPEPDEEPAPAKSAPDIEYWKARALQLQKEMQEKNGISGE